MRLPYFEYFEPETLKDAISLLSKHKGGARIIAGGTDLLPKIKKRVLGLEVLINLQDISGLNFIKEEDGLLKVGALTSLQQIEESSLMKENLLPMVEAAHSVGAIQLRHLATLGGNICQDTRCWYYDHSHLFGQEVWKRCFKRGAEVCHLIKTGKKCYAVYSGDIAPVLMASGAKVRLEGLGGERVISVSEIFSGMGDRVNVLQPEEVVTEIQIPKPSPSSFGVYLKYRERGAIDFAIVGVAILFTIDSGERVEEARVFLTSIGSSPVEAIKAEEILKGEKLGEGLFEEAAKEASQEVSPVPNHGYSVWYLREMVRVFVKRACMKAWENARGRRS